MLQPKLKYKGSLEKHYEEGPLIVIGNEGKLHQAFLNFISNSEQAISESTGKIDITTRTEGKNICIDIVDNGSGISKKNLKRIREPFFTTKPVGHGTGLGLSIAYQIIEEHQGRISVTSNLSKGTKFTITLPRI